jgi:ribosomal protein L11 methyltransferase
MPEWLDAFEGEVQSISLFEIEDSATVEPVGWQVDLLYREQPNLRSLRRRLRSLCRAGDLTFETVEIVPVAANDWVAATQLRLPPIVAGRFVVHGSHARENLPPGLVAIEIDAGLAFGSGEHATTRSCLLAIDRLARRTRFRRVLDVGCGSGVLAIAAARCWPAWVLAVDNDPVAVRVAAENLALNLPEGRAAAVLAEGYQHPKVRLGQPFDLILANILADPLIELAPDLARHLAAGGYAVLSGLLDRQAQAVALAHRRQRLRLVARLDDGPWTALVFYSRP